MKKLSILLVSDYSVVMDGLELVVNSHPNLQVIGKFSASEINSQSLAKPLPDIVVKEVSGSILRVINNIKLLKQIYEDVKVLVLTLDNNKNTIKQLCQAGASACILKNTTPQNFLLALRSVAGEETYLASSVLKICGSQDSDKTSNTKLSKLSEQEEIVLRALAWGHSNKAIADSLNISIKTVETYKSRLMEKLGLRSLVDILKYALDQGWLREEPNTITKPSSKTTDT